MSEVNFSAKKTLKNTDIDRTSLIQQYRAISTSTIGHLLTSGYLEGIQPYTKNTRFIGKVITVKIFPPESQAIREALIASEAGDVLVIECATNPEYACWGELRNLAAQVKGLAAVIIAGKVTDISAIRKQDLPVFANGISALTTRKNSKNQKKGHIYGPINVSGIEVHAGDIAIGDDDGVFVLSPKAAVDLLPHALNKETEDQLRRKELLEKLSDRLPLNLGPI